MSVGGHPPFASQERNRPPPYHCLGRNRRRGCRRACGRALNLHPGVVFNLFHVKLAGAARLGQKRLGRKIETGFMGEGFKAHGVELGPKLGQALASGLPRLARIAMGEDGRAARVEAARARVRAAEQARRAASAMAQPSPGLRERSVAEQGTGANTGDVKLGLAVSGGKRERGRPKVEGVRPWEAAGLSRTEWYRRKAGGKGEA